MTVWTEMRSSGLDTLFINLPSHIISRFNLNSAWGFLVSGFYNYLIFAMQFSLYFIQSLDILTIILFLTSNDDGCWKNGFVQVPLIYS